MEETTEIITKKLEEICYDFGYAQGHANGRNETITRMIELIKANPNIDVLDLLQKL